MAELIEEDETCRVAKIFLKKSVQSVHLKKKCVQFVQFLKKIRTNCTFKKNVTIFEKKHIKIQLFMCEGLNFFSRSSHYIAWKFSCKFAEMSQKRGEILKNPYNPYNLKKNPYNPYILATLASTSLNHENPVTNKSVDTYSPFFWDTW